MANNETEEGIGVPVATGCFLVGVTGLIALYLLQERQAGSGLMRVDLASPTASVGVDDLQRRVVIDLEMSANWPAQIAQWESLIEKYARLYGIDPNIIAGIILQESSGVADEVGVDGSTGLMGIVARDGPAGLFLRNNQGELYFANRPTMEELKDPEFNVAWGVDDFAQHLQREEGNIRLALAKRGPRYQDRADYYKYADKVLGHVDKYR